MFKKKIFKTAALAALAGAGGLAVDAHMSAAQAQEVTETWTGSVPEARSGEGRFRMRGRFQYDLYSADTEMPSSSSIDLEDGTRSYVRRAFLGVQGRLTDHWRYKVDFVLNPGSNDVSTTRLCQNTTTMVVRQSSSCDTSIETDLGAVGTGGGGEDVAVDDAYLEYAGDFYSIVIGEHNVTSPLEDRTSSLDTPFNERSALINAFGYGRAAGVGAIVNGANWMGAVAVQGDSVNNQDNNYRNDELTQYSGRFTWAPLFEASPDGYTLIHLGAHARYRYIGDDSGLQYRSRPFLGRGGRPLDVTSTAENDTSFGVEAAVQYNAFGATAEWTTVDAEAADDDTSSFDAFYVDVFFSPTGEPRNYRGNTGSFGAVTPRSPLGGGGIGHIMLGARYESLTLDADDDFSSSVLRGEQTGWGVGVDWVPVEHVKFKLNYGSTDFDYTDPAVEDAEAQVVSLRTQFDF
jgi:phosphate-selective porin OprO/OprP